MDAPPNPLSFKEFKNVLKTSEQEGNLFLQSR